ncbi:hypothetical protein [Lederbergia galactosidilytica]|uniref:hypothetical protein n=1 Tax=Lederbergia galactosidilytica TaxID=217031 RepID=UPI001AE78961|nr:hypothetical protein [Lederbergia galactosidilytica]
MKPSLFEGLVSDCRQTPGILVFVYSLFSFKIEIKLERLISAASGRFPQARLQPLPSLRSVQGLQLALFPLESPLSAPINGIFY